MQPMDGATSVESPARSAAEAEALVVTTIQNHADALLRVARRYSLCADDAQDAYQRGLEIFLRHSASLDASHAHKWLFRVVRNEAHAVREQRQRAIGHEDFDLDQMEARDEPSPEDRALAFDTVARSAEALQRLKPQEVRALWLKASGRSYAEIATEMRLDVHEGQPLSDRGAAELPAPLLRDRGRGGVRSLGADTFGAGRRGGDGRAAGGAASPPAQLRGLPCRSTRPARWQRRHRGGLPGRTVRRRGNRVG